jgi:hypothetical protein
MRKCDVSDCDLPASVIQRSTRHAGDVSDYYPDGYLCTGHAENEKTLVRIFGEKCEFIDIS